MKEDIKLSVIVPVYNTKSYLTRCLDSLVNQTLSEKEIILVDDGSNDGSEMICRQYEKRYSFIKLVRQNNSGTVVARQKGMENVHGEFFTFCDSDDFVSPDFYKNLYEAAKISDADIAQCGYSLYYSDENIISYPDSATGAVIRRANGDCSKIMDVLLLSPPLTVRRIHRTSLARKYNIGFDPNIRNSEDHLFSAQFFSVSQKVAYVDQTGYFYRQLRDGRMTSVGDMRLLDFFKIIDKFRCFLRMYSLQENSRIDLLEINTLLYPVTRMMPEVRKCYCREFISRLTCRKVFSYTRASFVYCWKMRLLKYYILNTLCCPLLMLIAVFRIFPAVAIPLLDAVVFMRKGNFFQKLKRKFI